MTMSSLSPSPSPCPTTTPTHYLVTCFDSAAWGNLVLFALHTMHSKYGILHFEYNYRYSMTPLVGHRNGSLCSDYPVVRASVFLLARFKVCACALSLAAFKLTRSKVLHRSRDMRSGPQAQSSWKTFKSAKSGFSLISTCCLDTCMYAVRRSVVGGDCVFARGLTFELGMFFAIAPLSLMVFVASVLRVEGT